MLILMRPSIASIVSCLAIACLFTTAATAGSPPAGVCDISLVANDNLARFRNIPVRQGAAKPTIIDVATYWAERDDAKAQFWLGSLYFKGKSVAKNHRLAFSWFEKLADNGSSLGLYNTGTMHICGFGTTKNQTKGLELLRKAAFKGDIHAQLKLGILHATGFAAIKDEAIALMWINKAAAAGLPDAQAQLGTMYLYGKGTSQDYAKAASLFKQAAKAGSAAGYHYLGTMTEHGTGVEKNLALSLKLHKKAAETGLRIAQETVSRFYASGIGIQADPMQACQWQLVSLPPQLRQTAKRCASLSPDAMSQAHSWAAAWQPTSQKKFALKNRLNRY